MTGGAGLGRILGRLAWGQSGDRRLAAIPGRQIGNRLIAEAGRDHAHHFMHPPPLAERGQLMLDIGRVLAADMGHDGHFGHAFDTVTGAALTGQFAPRLWVAGQSLCHGDLGEENPAQTQDTCLKHQLPSYQMR